MYALLIGFLRLMFNLPFIVRQPQSVWTDLRVRARITSHVWVLRHLSGKARGLRILARMERTSNAARRDGSTPKHGKLFLREPLPSSGQRRESLHTIGQGIIGVVQGKGLSNRG